MRSYKILFSILILLLLTGFSKGQDKEGDRILAIIGNELILESDLQYQLQTYAVQNQLNSISPFLAQQIFQQMITDKIIVAKAEQDSITVTEEEVNRELDNRIKTLVDQLGSEQKVEEAYKMSLVKIKLTLKEDLRKKLKAEKLKKQKFQTPTKVSDKEVREFYYNYKDSLPAISEEFDLYHIFVLRKITDTEKNLAREKALKILDSIKNGVDFSELAGRNSNDSISALNGGDLGWSKRGTFVKEFEEALLRLNIGEVSDIVETEFGYHIIKLTDKKGEQTRCQHILIEYPKLESSDFETISYLNNLRKEITEGKISFEDAATKYSQDNQTNSKGGYLGLVPVERLDSNVIQQLKKLSPGDVSEPIRIGDQRNYGYELLKFTNIIPSHKMTLEQDYDRVKRYAEFIKENKEMDKWINEIKQFIYIDIKM